MSADVEVTVIGAGVVGAAAALALARRGCAVALVEAEPEPGFGASGTNSGVVHTGFDSTPGELETEMILSAARLRDPVLEALSVPIMRCGAVMRPRRDEDGAAIAALAENARRNGVAAEVMADGALSIPGESITDPVAFTLALAGAAVAHGAALHCGFEVAAIERADAGLTLRSAGGETIRCRAAVNCAGLFGDAVARLAGDDSFAIYPRKGEFLVFDPPDGERLPQILLPVPTKRTKGVLVFPTLDGKIVAGPTAVDLEDKRDWSVRPQAREEILAKAVAMHPPLEGAEPVATYAGLRPAGRDVNYVIGPAHGCPQLINVAAIRSTGLTASLGIAQRIVELVAAAGVALGEEGGVAPATLPPAALPWWQRTAAHYAR